MATLDLYDHEMKKIADVYGKLTALAGRMPNSKRGIEEFAKIILDEFHKAGFIVSVDMSACGIINPKTGRSHSPEIEVIGRLDDPFSMNEIDHDKRRFEVIDGNAYGEKYRGEKRTNVDRQRKKS